MKVMNMKMCCRDFKKEAHFTGNMSVKSKLDKPYSKKKLFAKKRRQMKNLEVRQRKDLAAGRPQEDINH